jgi:ataxia telangiectasia mutated family protein
MATRMTLLRSARHQLQRDQIGNIMSPAAQCLLDAERDSLLCVAEAAREFHQLQLALNAVTRARALETPPSVAVMQEFSCVLWSLNEQKLAIQSLKQLVSAQEDTQMEPSVQRSLMLSRLVSNLTRLPRGLSNL